MQDIINGRCGWCGTDELYVKYHDEEWGRLVTDDRTLFEFLVLESSQAGLSWITILKKREGYRKAFCNFINRKTFCSAFPNHFVSILHLLTQNELWFFHSFSNNF